ncbi:multi-sensor hybrid histidine kinase [Phaffia rhodozyma]|uniref:Multi-sensor hybrid histidine kinase n=1 Tax=Phaffia rhodozyma TaxID=264483 RepID=A0A0F7SXF6_PHARH|nr:multi-sensor hybrid histidine kinase [Phaffia rhodozyma]
MSVPDYASKGLSQIDLKTVEDGQPVHYSLSGRALWEPTEDFQVLDWPGRIDLQPRNKPRRVEFFFTYSSHKEGSLLFQRNRRLFNLFAQERQSNTYSHSGSDSEPDTSGVLVTRNASRRSNTSVKSSISGTLSSDNNVATSGVFLPFLNSILAFWEDSEGLWMIVDDEHRNYVTLEEYWVGSVQKREIHEVNEDEELSSGVDRDTLAKAGRRCALACEVLLKVAEVLITLHERKISLPVCRAEFFRIRLETMSTEEYYEIKPSINNDPIKYQVELMDLSTAVFLPGFDRDAFLSIFPDRASMVAPVVSSTEVGATEVPAYLVAQAEDETQRETGVKGRALAEILMHRHLRFLGPEFLSTRRAIMPQVTLDVYSFGVFCYEMVTGVPIEPMSSSELDMLTDVHRHITRKVQPPDIVPPSLAEIIMLCLEKDPTERYSSIKTMLYDLNKFTILCYRGNSKEEISRLRIGEANRASKFQIPKNLIDRENEIGMLDRAFYIVCSASATHTIARRSTVGTSSLPASELMEDGPNISNVKGVFVSVNIYGNSGCGKSKLVEVWAKKVVDMDKGKSCLLGWAKLDLHMKKPFSGFVQIFEGLLDRVFTDPKVDAREWRKKILNALPANLVNTFLSLISAEWRDFLLLSDPDLAYTTTEVGQIDWTHFTEMFEIWSKTLLQVFATHDRPLVLVLDDIQALAPEELILWRNISLQTKNRLEHALLITLYRTENLEPPPEATNIPSPMMLHITRLNEQGVEKFLSACFGWDQASISAVANSPYLVSFLYSQTDGNLLFLRSLVAALVREGVIFFAFDLFQWKFDIFALQDHSSVGVDEFLDSILKTLPENVQEALEVLSCLQSRACKIEHLAMILGKERHQTEVMLHTATLLGIVILDDKTVRFSHDRQQAASYRLLSSGSSMANTHFRIASCFHHSDFSVDFIYDIVDNYVIATKHGRKIDNEDELVLLACQAAQRASRSASIRISMDYLKLADDIAKFSEPEAWIRTRSVCFFYAEVYSDVAALMNDQVSAISKMEEFLKFTSNTIEQLKIVTIIIRCHISAGSYLVAVDELVAAVRMAGYEDFGTKLFIPSRDEDFARVSEWTFRPPPIPVLTPEEEIQALLCTLIASVGPTLYVTLSPHAVPLLRLGVGLLSQSVAIFRNKLGVTTYIFSTYSLSTALSLGVHQRKNFVDIARAILPLIKGTFFEGPSVIVIYCQSLVFEPLPCVMYDPSFKLSSDMGNTDVLTYAVALEFSTRFFSGYRFDKWFQKIIKWYPSVDATTKEARVLIDTSIQAAENMCHPSKPCSELSRLNGVYIQEADYDLIKSLPLYSLGWITTELSLAIHFGSSSERLVEIVQNKGKVDPDEFPSMVYHLEWLFYTSLIIVWYGTDEEQVQVQQHLDRLRRDTMSIDYELRREIIVAFSLVRKSADLHSVLNVLDGVIEQCEQLERMALLGLINRYVARWLQKAGKRTISVGYARAASNAYNCLKTVALSRSVAEEFPSAFQSMKQFKTPLPLPSGTMLQLLPTHRLISPGQLLRSESDSTINKPSSTYLSNSTMSTTSLKHEDGSSPDNPETALPAENNNIDHLTFVRSSLVIAGEKDPDVITVKMMDILLQFVRGDYGALALIDSKTSELHLRASGEFGAIAPFNVPLSAAEQLCPASTLLHVFRTKKKITSHSATSSLRQDNFLSNRVCRSLLALPLTNKRRLVGVILLSSASYVASASLIDQQIDMVSSLATFAAMAVESSLLTRSLEGEVATRTRDLEEALAAKQKFISHMSHEMRTPLFAILGLSAVLQEAPDLSPLQHEHLETIRRSGDDLQTIIKYILYVFFTKPSNHMTYHKSIIYLFSNVLDLSKLQSGSLTPEFIPFNLRSIIELAVDSIALSIQNRNRIEIFIGTDVSKDPPSLLGDPYRIRQILLNLLSNASKFTESGSVIIRWQIEDMSVEEDTKSVTVSVEDTGCGIPAQKMDRIFKTFSQVDASITRSYGGSGLGLVISQSLARLLGGDAWATSTLWKGSTFYFSFISKVDRSPPVLPKLSPPSQPFTAGLLFEESVARDVFIRNLNAYGAATVSTFSSYSSAIASESFPSFANTQFSFIFIDSRLVTKDELERLSMLQPKATVTLLVRTSELVQASATLGVSQGSILTRPVKVQSLLGILTSANKASNGSPLPKAKKKTDIDKNLGSNNPLKILLVDDNKVNTVVGQKILQRFGYRDVDIVFDGAQAIESAESSRYDLILMDLSMPVCDGHTAQKRIMASPLTGNPPVVALTANTDSDTQALCQASGFFAYLSKPLVSHYDDHKPS